jgi:hypothetical protein
MMAVCKADRVRRLVAVATVAALLLGAFALSGCGGTIESPGGPSGTGVPEGAEALVAPDAVRTEVLSALSAAGFAVSDPMYVYVNYESAAKDTVLVTGSFKAPAGLAKGGALTSYSWAKVKSAGGKWAVAEVK